VISSSVPLVALVLLVVAFFDFSLLSCHFWPFTGVLRKIFGSLTREVWQFLRTPRIARMTRMVLGWRPPRRTPYNCMLVDAPGSATARRPTVFDPRYPCDPSSGKLFQLG